MKFNIGYNRDHILILGAGASIEYGLPVWAELSDLIREKIKNDSNGAYTYSKEILEWLEEIGDNKQYKTLDECIEKESVSERYHSNGEKIENQIFQIIKDSFTDKYLDNKSGWIKLLNDKILLGNVKNIQNRMVFISYNYDDVLDRNFLNYSYLASKYKRLNYKYKLERLSSVSVKTLYAHGNLFPEDEADYDSNISRSIQTIKTDEADFLDAVSCYESEGHIIHSDTREPLKIYILGLGGGLEINLNNIVFSTNPVMEVHVTIREEKNKNKVLDFLSEKYSIPSSDIKVYNSCQELIERNFDDNDF